MLITFFNSLGIIYHHYSPAGKIMDVKYKKMFINFNRQMKIKRPESEHDGFILLQDNARPHLTIENSKYLKKEDVCP